MSPLQDIAVLFLKLGTTAFGGPAAHIAMMNDEVVRRRQWMREQQFLDYLSATNFIPGPNSTEMAIHIGYSRAGWPGLMVAGTCFILPATVIVACIAWLYVKYGALPQFAGPLYAIKPVVIAIVVQALWRLSRSAVRTKRLLVIGILCLMLNIFGVHELLVLAVGGVLSLATGLERSRTLAAVSGFVGGTSALATTTPSISSWPIFLLFAKIGSVLFGSGYVLLAFLRADLVERFHWLTEKQLLDAVAVGQITPGPVFTTATFVGYLLHGPSGALAATIGIFLPAFLFVALTAPVMPKLRSSRTMAALLDGINVGSMTLMALVTWQLTKTAIIDWLTLGISLLSAFLLFRFHRLNSAWLVVAAAALGAGKALIR